jgi:hypothetical protein
VFPIVFRHDLVTDRGADRFVVALSLWIGHLCILMRVWFRLAVGISRSV